MSLDLIRFRHTSETHHVYLPHHPPQCRRIDPTTLEYTRPQGTLLPPPYPVIPNSTRIPITCPSCFTVNLVYLICDPTLRDTTITTKFGFAQKEFKHGCTTCHLELTHESLRAGKFALHVAKVLRGEMDWLPGIGMNPTNGQLSDPTDKKDPGTFVSLAIAGVYSDNAQRKGHPIGTSRIHFPRNKLGKINNEDANLPTHQLARQIGNSCSWSMNDMQSMLETAGRNGLFKGFRGGPRMMAVDNIGRRMNRMHTAYAHSSMASLALGPAAMRQATFVAKMKDLGWLEPGRWDGGSGKSIFLLQRSAARYREL